MIKDDILRMAREANLPDPMVFYASIERFAALVAAAEREACYQIALTIGDDDAGCRHTDEVARRIRARSQQ